MLAVIPCKRFISSWTLFVSSSGYVKKLWRKSSAATVFEVVFWSPYCFQTEKQTGIQRMWTRRVSVWLIKTAKSLSIVFYCHMIIAKYVIWCLISHHDSSFWLQQTKDEETQTEVACFLQLLLKEIEENESTPVDI